MDLADTVNELKKTVQAQMTPVLDNIHVNRLDLWRVFLPLTQDLKDNYKRSEVKLGDDSVLLSWPVSKLETIFKLHPPAQDQVHIVIKKSEFNHDAVFKFSLP